MTYDPDEETTAERYHRALRDDQPDDPEVAAMRAEEPPARCGKRWSGGTMFQCICARPDRHDGDHECVCGETMAAVLCPCASDPAAACVFPDEGNNITAIMVPGQETRFTHNLAYHPGTLELLSRLAEIPGLQFQQINETTIPGEGQIKIEITVWVQG